MKFITRYEIKNHGVENCQYWHGYKSDKFESTYVGVGFTPYDALEDAMDTAAIAGWDVDGEQSKSNRIESSIFKDKTSLCDTVSCANRRTDGEHNPTCDGCEMQYYVSLALT